MNTSYVDWGMSFSIPDDKYDKFYESVCIGQVGWKVFTGYDNILFCAQEKSGSHHVNLLLSLALGYESVPIGFNIKGNKIYYPRVLALKFMDRDTISRCHAANDLDVTAMIENLDLKPLVLTRNLLDGLVSRRDHVMRTNFGDDIKTKREFKKFYRGDDEYQMDVVIERYANMYIDFYTSWDAFTGDLIWITYADMVNDEVGMVGHVADELGCKIVNDVEKISAEIKRAGGANFNKGVIGRGAGVLNERQRGELRRRADILGCDNEEFLGGLI